MKKAKIMLSAIAVIALIGGALAFKAQKFQHLTYYTCNTLAIPQTCASTTALGQLGSLTTAFDPSFITVTTAGGIDPAQSGQQCSPSNCSTPIYAISGL